MGRGWRRSAGGTRQLSTRSRRDPTSLHRRCPQAPHRWRRSSSFSWWSGSRWPRSHARSGFPSRCCWSPQGWRCPSCPECRRSRSSPSWCSWSSWARSCTWTATSRPCASCAATPSRSGCWPRSWWWPPPRAWPSWRTTRSAWTGRSRSPWAPRCRPPTPWRPVQVLESESADPRLLAVVRGESLLNDGVAFALVAVAGTAAAAEKFDAAKGLLELVVYIVGGVAFGLLVAVADREAALALDVHPDRGRPLAADPLRRLPGRRAGARLGHPGRRGRRPVGGPPLARVRRSPGPDRDPGRLARGRLRLNSLLFMLVGLQTRDIIDTVDQPMGRVLLTGAAVTAAVIGIRLLWALTIAPVWRGPRAGPARTCARRRRGRSGSCWAGAGCGGRWRWPPRWPSQSRWTPAGRCPGASWPSCWRCS